MSDDEKRDPEKPEPIEPDAVLDEHGRDLSRVVPHLRKHCFKPGQTGNPNGRPKKVTFEQIVAKVLDEKIGGRDGVSVTRREALARVLVDECLRRNSGLIREVLAREWPAVQSHAIDTRIEIGGEDRRAALAGRLDRLAAGEDDDASRRDH